MTNICVRCGAPTPDGYACARCCERAREQLAEIADMVPAARDIAHRLSSTVGGGAASGKPGSSLPLDLGAMSRLDAVGNVLGTWMRHIAEERGADTPDVSHWHDPVEGLTTKLGNHVEWMRHRPEVDEFLVDVEAAARVIRGLARGPREQRYLGPCGAPVVAAEAEAEGGCPVNCACHNGPHYACDEPGGCGSAGCGRSRTTGETCEGDVYGAAGAAEGRCRTCGAVVDQSERRVWLDEQVADKAFRLSHIADAYGLKLKTLRDWAADRPEVRAPNGVVVRSAKPAKLRVHGTDRHGKQLFLVGDVLELARAAALKRAQNEARRDRQENAA